MRPFDLSIDDPNTPQTTTSKTPRDDRKDPSQEDIFARILGGARSDTDTPSRPELALEAQLLGTWGSVSSAERGAELLQQARTERDAAAEEDATDTRDTDADAVRRGERRARATRGDASSSALRQAVQASTSKTLNASGLNASGPNASGELGQTRAQGTSRTGDLRHARREDAAASRHDATARRDGSVRRAASGRSRADATTDADRRERASAARVTRDETHRAETGERAAARSAQERQAPRGTAAAGHTDAADPSGHRAGAGPRSPGIHRVGSSSAATSTAASATAGSSAPATPAVGPGRDTAPSATSPGRAATAAATAAAGSRTDARAGGPPKTSLPANHDHSSSTERSLDSSNARSSTSSTYASSRSSSSSTRTIVDSGPGVGPGSPTPSGSAGPQPSPEVSAPANAAAPLTSAPSSSPAPEAGPAVSAPAGAPARGAQGTAPTQASAATERTAAIERLRLQMVQHLDRVREFGGHAHLRFSTEGLGDFEMTVQRAERGWELVLHARETAARELLETERARLESSLRQLDEQVSLELDDRDGARQRRGSGRGSGQGPGQRQPAPGHVHASPSPPRTSPGIHAAREDAPPRPHRTPSRDGLVDEVA